MTVSWAGRAAGIEKMNSVGIFVETLVSVTEKRYLRADFLCLGEQLVGTVLNAETVTVSKKHLDLTCIVKVAVRRKGIVIAVPCDIQYHFFGIYYSQLIYFAFAVAEENKSINVLIALHNIVCGSEISVRI